MKRESIDLNRESLVGLSCYPINCLDVKEFSDPVVNKFFADIKKQSQLHGVPLNCRYFEANFEAESGIKEFWGFLITAKRLKPIVVYPQQTISRKREEFIYSQLMRLIQSEHKGGLN